MSLLSASSWSKLETANKDLPFSLRRPLFPKATLSNGAGGQAQPDCDGPTSCNARSRVASSCAKNGSTLDLTGSWGVLGSSCTYTSTVYSVPATSGNTCVFSNGVYSIQQTGNNCTITTTPLSQVSLAPTCSDGFCDGAGGYGVAYTQSVIPAGCTP